MKDPALNGVILIFLSFFIIQCSAKTLPVEISGKWTTDSEAFQGEYIEISAGSLVFGAEGKDSFKYTIKKIKTEKGPIHNTTLYRVYCADETGDENMFSFIYSPQEGGTLRYKSSQDTLWKRS